MTHGVTVGPSPLIITNHIAVRAEGMDQFTPVEIENSRVSGWCRVLLPRFVSVSRGQSLRRGVALVNQFSNITACPLSRPRICRRRLFNHRRSRRTWWRLHRPSRWCDIDRQIGGDEPGAFPHGPRHGLAESSRARHADRAHRIDDQRWRPADVEHPLRARTR